MVFSDRTRVSYLALTWTPLITSSNPCDCSAHSPRYSSLKVFSFNIKPVCNWSFHLNYSKILNAIDAWWQLLSHSLSSLDDGTLDVRNLLYFELFLCWITFGPFLGIFVTVAKCEVFCNGDTSEIPPSTKSHLDILGAPIGDYVHFLCKLFSFKAFRSWWSCSPGWYGSRCLRPLRWPW